MAKRYWLVKSEPDVYSIEDLERDGSTRWEGVRNYKARNNLRAMEVGDEVLYYHSNAKPSGVVGIARVSRAAYPDPCQFEPASEYHDARSDPADPRWSVVDLAFGARFSRMVSLDEIRGEPPLAGMELLRQGRLSVQSVTKSEFDRLKQMGGIQ